VKQIAYTSGKGGKECSTIVAESVVQPVVISKSLDPSTIVTLLGSFGGRLLDALGVVAWKTVATFTIVSETNRNIESRP